MGFPPLCGEKRDELMTYYDAGQYDIAVIGAGHAGIEAALAAARMGLRTVCFTINLDAVGNMPCNPAIGGTGKGHLVRELDALGGEMGRAADKACIQYRILNRGKGPAVWSLRAQADRREYQKIMKHTLERQENLWVKQAEVVAIRTENGAVSAVVTHTGAVFAVKAAIIATGTYLGGRTIVGEVVRDSGPDGLAAALPLTQSLLELGVSIRRFKTGTPPRVNARSVDFSQMELQEGDPDAQPFSFTTHEHPQNRAVCYLTYTNEKTHDIIRANLDRSPLYDGTIEGVGPRYCPSIETKIVRFPDKERHQLFVEPMGLDTEELYIQGFSSSLPEDVQVQNEDELGELVDNINDMSLKIGQNEKMKSEFISSVSHELRTPLTAINGWGETILADPTGDPEQMRRGIRIILNESRRLSTMVEELLEFSKMEDGRFTLRIEEVDLQAEFEDAVFTYRQLFRQEGIDLEYESGDELLPPIPGDPERLKQVFCNVLDNAAKHGGSGKRITASVCQEGEYEVVRVRDYGPGIPEAELPFIKQKFYKGSSKARGSGIGLAVCDEIVRLHGGTFDIGNAEGGGAVVTVRLPEKK